MGCSSSNINKNSSLFLKDEIKSVLTYTTQRDSIATEVSSVSDGWHLEHILLTINQVYSALEKSNPEDFRESLNSVKSMQFALSEMPLGKIKVSKNESSHQIIILEQISLDYEQANINLLQIELLPEKSFFNHSFLGNLEREKAKRFLEIHTNHHLNIINDIITTVAE